MPDNIKSPIADLFALNKVYQETKDQISKRVSKTSYDLDERLGSDELPYKQLFVQQITSGDTNPSSDITSYRGLEIKSANILASGKSEGTLEDPQSIESSDVVINNQLGVKNTIRTQHTISNDKSSSKFFQVFEGETIDTGIGMKYNNITKGIDFIC